MKFNLITLKKLLKYLNAQIVNKCSCNNMCSILAIYVNQFVTNFNGLNDNRSFQIYSFLFPMTKIRRI